jgi:hypothetical protein
VVTSAMLNHHLHFLLMSEEALLAECATDDMVEVGGSRGTGIAVLMLVLVWPKSPKLLSSSLST